MIEIANEESPASVGSHYDDLDEFYREIWGLHVHHGLWEKGDETPSEATLKLVRRLVKDIELGPDKKVCDIGCGYGGTAKYLAENRGVHVTGLSVSEKQVEFARTLTRGLPVKILFQDWMKNQLPSESFDLAISIESSEHMPDLPTFFTEAHRVLKTGGLLRICAWLNSENSGEMEEKFLLRPICREGRMRLGTISEYKDLLLKSGFDEIGFVDLTDEVKKTWTICLARCAGKLLTDPKYLGFLLNSPSKNKSFLFSLLRIRIAYELKSMRYGIFTGRKA